MILVLKGVSLQVPEGGIVALLGGNGAGKTTTLRAVSATCSRASAARSPRARSSCAASASRTLTPADLVERGVVQVMEGRHCFAHLTIEENLLTGAYTRSDGKAAIAATLEKVYAYFPRLKTRRDVAGGLHLGRRAADVRDRPRADGQPEDGAARRAVDGPGAADRRGGVRDREGPERARKA